MTADCCASKQGFSSIVPPSSVPPNKKVPIVLVPGLGAPAIQETSDVKSPFYSYWGSATCLGTASSPVLCVWPAGFASLHDRACEIFAQLKGGMVDYGEEHSLACGHSRFGRQHTGCFPEWSAANPVHMVGHSLGGNTIRVLQYLLSIKAFPGHDTSEDWIVSISTLNSPHNGTLAAYAIGQNEVAAGSLKSFSVGHTLCSFVLSCLYLGISPLGLDLGLDQWNLSIWNGCRWHGVQQMVKGIFLHSTLAESQENAFFETTVHAMAQWNERIGACFPNTFYLSCVGTGEEANTVPRLPVQGKPWRCARWVGELAAFACRRSLLSACQALTKTCDFRALRTSLATVDWDHVGPGNTTDGLVSTASQSYPQIGIARSTPNCKLPPAGTALCRGVWYVEQHGHDHLGIVPFPACEAAQRRFFSALFARLRTLPLMQPPSARPAATRGPGLCGRLEPLPARRLTLDASALCPRRPPSQRQPAARRRHASGALEEAAGRTAERCEGAEGCGEGPVGAALALIQPLLDAASRSSTPPQQHGARCRCGGGRAAA